METGRIAWMGVIRRGAAVLCTMLLMLVPMAARAAETVVWAVLDFPPFQIREGEHRGTGSFDGLLDLLIRELPQFEHEVVMMSFARREEEIRQGRRLCTPGLFRTPEREKLLAFSLPALIHLDNRLVVRADRVGSLPRERPLRLAALLADPTLIGGVIADRSFAPNIDPLLRQSAGAPNLVTRTLKSAQLFEMLTHGDIDYTILFPHEAAYLAQAVGKRDSVRVLPIADTPAHIVTHVACSGGAWGEATIAAVDRVLRLHQRSAEYRAFSERWYEEADKAQIRAYYGHMLTDGQRR